MESSQPDMQLLLDFGPTFKLSVIEPSENAFSFGDSAETRPETSIVFPKASQFTSRSISLDVARCRSMPLDAARCRSIPLDAARCRSMPINADTIGSQKKTLNASPHRRSLINC